MSEPDSAILAMPSPSTLRAPAVWITARNWALACQQMFGWSAIVTPEGHIPTDSLANLIDDMLARPPAEPRQMSRMSREARTLAKDARTAIRNMSGRELAPYLEPVSGKSPAFVWQHHDPFFRLGERLAGRMDIPLIQFVDAPHVWEARRWGLQRPGWGGILENRGEVPQLRHANHIACVSDSVADAVAELGISRDKIQVAPCTAAPEFYELAQGSDQDRARFGVPPDATVLGWAGSFRKFHAIEDLLFAFDKCAKSRPLLWLLLLGDGVDRRRVQSLASRLDSHDRIQMPGAVPFSKMPSALGTFDVAVVTGRDAETFHYSPLKLREYRAAGRAIVAPAIGQMTQALRNGEDALLYRAGDIDSLTEQLARAADNQRLRAMIGAAGRDAEFRSKGAVGQVEIALRSLAEDTNRP